MMIALGINVSAAAPATPDSQPTDPGALLVQTLQAEVQKQQEEIDIIAAANVVGVSLIRDMAVAAMEDDAIMDFLNKNGFEVKGSNKRAASIPLNQTPVAAAPILAVTFAAV